MKILAMSSFIPEHICDIERFTQFNGDRNISNYCGYASDFISRVIQDKEIDGAVYPLSCDSTRVITSYLSDCKKFFHQIRIPSYNTLGAELFFAKEIKRYKCELEKYFGISINNVNDRIEKINNRNNVIKNCYKNIENIKYSDYIKSIHEMLKQPLMNQILKPQINNKNTSSKKVFLVGSFLSNINIINLIENTGLTIAGDTLPESGRLCTTTPVKINDDIYLEISKSILSAKLSPTQNSFKTIVTRDFEEINRKNINGIIFITQKYCESYDYLYSVYKSIADSKGIPIIQIGLNNTEDNGNASLAIEAFADTI